MKHLKISSNILSILAECRVEGNVLYLPPRQLERATYEAVNKCIVNIGGKWDRKAKGHVFDYDPSEALENLIFTGETEDIKKTFQFFPTPKPIALKICEMADLAEAKNILEPSCGKGDLADVIYEQNQNVIGIELNADMNKYLAGKPYKCIVGRDFLDVRPGDVKSVDRVVMNPPFSRQQDIDHIYHAYDILSSGGILVSIVSPSPFFRDNDKSVRFRNWLDSLRAEIVDVEAGAFKESGTMVATKIVKVYKP